METTTAGTGMEVAKAAGWGKVPSWTFTGKLRERKSTFDLRNRVSASRWLVGFVCQATEAHHRDGAAAERTLWTAYTPSEDTMAPETERRFGAKDANCVGQANGASPAGLNLTTTRAYDNYGNPTSETVSGGNVESRTTTASAFSDARHPGAVANHLGHRETFAYDPRFGVPESVADANGRTTSRKLDPFGRVVELTSADGVVFTTAYRRCGSGFACASVDGVAPAMAVETDSPATPKVTRYLDRLGRVVRVRTESFANANDILEDARHDTRGRVLRRSAPYFENVAAASVPKTSYEYDDLDRVTKETRPDGGVTTYAYAAGTDGATTVTATEKVYAGTTLAATIATVATHNLLGEVASVTEASGTTDAATTTYTYDASGLPSTVAVGGTTVATFAHDAAGNRTSATDPNTGTTTFTHTALGQTRTARNALGQTTTYAYDVLGRVTSRSDADGKAIWTYDPTNGKGMLHQRCRGSATLTGCGGTPDFAETLTYGMKARPSRAATVIRADGQAVRAYAREFTYDSGRLSTESHPSGVTTLREYNARGYLAAVKDDGANPKTVLERHTATDAFGSVTAVTHGNGAKTARTFDANTGRQTGVETARGTGAAKTVAQDFDYAWRSDGTLSSRAKASATPKLTETLTRDPLRRLTRAKVGTDGRSLTYGHDALGNLLNRTSTAGADKNVELCGHNTGPASARGPHAPRFALVGDERRALAYDAAGRMTSRTACAGAATECTTGACAAKANADNRYVTWNAQGEATRVLLGSSATDATPTVREDFARGPDGRLHFRKSTWRESGAERVERRYMVGRFEEVVPAYASSTNEWVRKTLLTDTVLHVQVKPRGGAATSRYEYLHRDHLGSVTAVTDAAGAASRQTTHDPYGVRRVSDWTRAETPAETARWADDDTRSTRGFGGHGQLDRASLVDTGGRLYDPELGIFLSPDPLVPDPFSSQGWNPYSYVGNRPLSRVDPTGFMFAPAGCNIGGVLCPGGGSGGGAGGTGGGFSTRAVWAVEAVFGVRWGLVVNLLFDPDLGFDVHYDWRPQPYFSVTARQVSIPNDGQPGDERLIGPKRSMHSDHPELRISLIRGRMTATSDIKNGAHHYLVRGLICRGSTKGCGIDLAKAVYDYVNKNDVPFSDEDSGEGRKVLLWFPIYHREFPAQRKSVNETLAGHVFHPPEGDSPGEVIFTVPIDSKTGDIYVQIEGNGTGPWPLPNNILGRALFESLVYRTMLRYMR